MVNDGLLDSNTGTKTVSLTPTDTLSTVTDTAGKTGWTEAAGLGANTAVAIDSGLTVTDPDNTTLASAKVSITTNFVSGQDVLAFAPGAAYGNIAAVYDPATGILSLTSAGATATLAQWQAALDSVTYNNTSHNPTTTDRTITFVVNDGLLDSNTGTKTVSLTPTDTLSTVTDTAGKTGWTEAAGLGANTAVAIDSGVTVTDPDNTTLASAKVSITTNFVSGQDVLAFAPGAAYGNIAAVYDPATGILSLTSAGATATLAQWQAALDSVTYNNTSHNPTTTDRTITFVVNDGLLDSNTGTKTVSLTPTDTLSTVTDTAGKTGWTEAAGLGANTAVAIDSGLTVTDPDNTTLASAKVSITTNFVSGQDVLAFAPGAAYGNIAAVYDPATGILSLTSAGATATLAQWQAALDAVTYNNTSHNPTTTDRTITFVVNDGLLDSNTGTKTVSLTATDTLSTVTDTAGKTGWTEAAGLGANTAVAIDSGLTVTDPDNTTLASAKVSITTNFVSGQDVLAFAPGAAYGNIAAVYDPATGILSLTSAGATATLAQWQAALDSVTYNNTSHNPTTTDRTITFVVNDGLLDSNTGTKTVSLTPTDTLPTVTDTAGKTGWTEAAGLGANTAVAIDGGAHGYRSRQHDAGLGEGLDHGQLRVRPGRAGIYDPATAYGNIAAVYDSATGILSLTSAGATATLAQWQAALDAVTYNNTSHNPTTTDRTITFVVNDGRSTATPAPRR